MNFYSVRIEKIIPLFTGVLGSLVLCALIAFHTSFFVKPEIAADTAEFSTEEKYEAAGLLLTEKEIVPDSVLEYYRNDEYREWVISFFTGLCSNRDIAKAILSGADEFDVPVALAFALSWEESKFNPRAVNRRNRDGSIDRGLFQLNSRSFPDLDISDFYGIRSNARYGIGHLRHCLNSGGSEVSALAMYNAGAGKVNNTGAPKVTLDYISRILENRSKIESRFHTLLIEEEESRIVEEVKPAQPQFSRTLSSASPL